MVANVSERCDDGGLAGRTLYIPQMSHAAARMMAAAYRSVGVNALVTPASSAETLELGGQHSSGEECLPHKVTLGDFLRICRAPGFDPQKAAFFMPKAPGPCRFGQYAPYLRRVLDELGYREVLVVSPTSSNSYDGVGGHAGELMRTVWMGIVVGELATKLLRRVRPYETRPGAAEAVFQECLDQLERVVARRGPPPAERLAELVGQVEQMRDRFRAVPAAYVRGRPLIGVVGEIFCRVNTFSNEDLVRRVERLGGECWVSDLMEWVWYTNWSRQTDILRQRGWFNVGYLEIKLKGRTQQRYERALTAPLAADFKGYEEPHDVRECLAAAEPYLPPSGALGEMVLSVGKGVYFYRKGADGIIDISPFTCMNGIVCEAVYPALSADHDDLPIRTCYFDKVNMHIDRDLEIFLDLARAYQKRKRHPRVYPDCFG